MIKVLVISEEGRGGGPLQRILTIAQKTKESIDTTVICPKGSPFEKKLMDANIPAKGISLRILTKNPRLLSSFLIFLIPEIFTLFKIIKREKPDIVHVASSSQIKGLIAAKLTGTKTIWQMNDSYQPRTILTLFKLVAPLADNFTFVAQRAKDYYNSVQPKIQKKPSWILQTAVDLKTIQPTKKALTTTTRLLLIGYINIHKGIDLLINSLALIPDQQVIVDVAGPVLDTQQDYFAQLEKIRKEKKVTNINFLGYQKIDSTFLSPYHFGICTSRREASPTAIWECLAAGLPVISTNVGDVHHFIKKYDCGICIDSFETESIAEKIKMASQIHHDAYQTLSHNAVKAAYQEFNLETSAAQYIQVYKSVAL